jgi:hypothetical protein
MNRFSIPLAPVAHALRVAALLTPAVASVRPAQAQGQPAADTAGVLAAVAAVVRAEDPTARWYVAPGDLLTARLAALAGVRS